jgi:uncharacterized protein (TIGR02145 family)
MACYTWGRRRYLDRDDARQYKEDKMKTLHVKVIQTAAMLLGATFIAGCGGGGGGSATQGAIDLIAAYAQSNTNPVPSIQDYSDAGITGVSADNLAAANAMVDKGVQTDYDTATEIQALIDLIGAKAVPDRNFGDGEHDFIYGVVTNTATGKTWLNNNLGARYSNSNDANFDPKQQATSPSDFLAQGSLFQWGRKADGHELILRGGMSMPRYGSTFVKSNVPAHKLFIKSTVNPYDWRINQNSSLWTGASAINNVCPVGYRVPNLTEFNAEAASWASLNTMGAFGSSEVWTTTGFRVRHNANLSINSNGYYWTSNTSGSWATYGEFESTSASSYTTQRAYGMAVRCIKN